MFYYLAEGHEISKATQAAMGRAMEKRALLLSPISAWEIGLATGPDRKYPLNLLPTPREFVLRAMSGPGVAIAELTPEIMFAASHLPGDPHRDPADRLLIATARAYRVPLVTDDRAIIAYGKRGYLDVLEC